MSNSKSLFSRVISRAALGVSALALTACVQQPKETGLSQPLPPPSQSAPVGNYTPPVSGPKDAVLRGAAFAAKGDGRFPPNSRMIVRVYDAAVGDVNRPVIERTFTRSGSLPWPYELRVPVEAVRGLSQPAVAARIEGPRGRLIYQNAQAVILKEGGSDDIPMNPVDAGGVSSSIPAPSIPNQTYSGAPVRTGPQPNYGIPDYNQTYGAQRYDAPTYPGQSYEPTSISGPPSNIAY